MGLEANGTQELELSHACVPEAAARRDPAKPRQAPSGAGRGRRNPHRPTFRSPSSSPRREELSPEEHKSWRKDGRIPAQTRRQLKKTGSFQKIGNDLPRT